MNGDTAQLELPTLRARKMRRARRGLAPMEFVMWIPALLFVAALMLNYGTALVWRARGEIASRDIAWRARWSRAPDFEEIALHDEAWRANWTNNRVIEAPHRPIWPVDAQLTVVDERPVLALDDPFINHPVARGPLPNRFVVRDTLNPAKGALQGNAAVTRAFPMLPKLGLYRTGVIRDVLLDQLWPCSETGSVNIARRIPVLYQLPLTDQSLPAAFVNAHDQMLAIPHLNGLNVLDHDDEVLKYQGRYADFHPRIHQSCELDPEIIQRTEVNRLVISTDARGQRQLGEVLHLPRTMTGYYLDMYRREIARLKAEIESMKQELKDLPGRLISADPQLRAQLQQRLAAIPGLIAANEAAIPPLEAKVKQLESFQRRIPGWEREMRTR